MKKRFAILALLLATALAVAAPAIADPIRITGGQLNMQGVSGTLLLLGERSFSLSARVGVTDGVFAPHSQCIVPQCRPGVAIGLEAVWVGLSLRDAVATLEGETFSTVGGLLSTSSAGVRFTGRVTAPPLEADTATVRAPFTFQGQFIHPNPEGTGTIGESLFGRGMATLSLHRNPIGEAWSYTGALYEFDPVPEPATILLTGAGLVALARAARRRRAPS
jgi:hypothetical protein